MSINAFDALENVYYIGDFLEEKEFSSLSELDDFIIDLDGTDDKSFLGANVLLSISAAAAKAFSADNGKFLWRFLRDELGDEYYSVQNPRLFANLINGGLHSGSGLAFQEYLAVPETDDIEKAVFQLYEIHKILADNLKDKFGVSALDLGDEGGFTPQCGDEAEPLEILEEVFEQLDNKEEISLGIDAAGENIDADPSEMLEVYENMIDKFKLSYLEDPFGENDFSGFSKILKNAGDRCIIIGDDLTTTNIERMQKAKRENSVNGVIIKPNQIGTLSEALEAIRFAIENDWFVVVSHRSGETNDDFIADLAYGAGADGIKLGAPSRGERVAKYNRLLEIVEKEA